MHGLPHKLCFLLLCTGRADPEGCGAMSEVGDGGREGVAILHIVTVGWRGGGSGRDIAKRRRGSFGRGKRGGVVLKKCSEGVWGFWKSYNVVIALIVLCFEHTFCSLDLLGVARLVSFIRRQFHHVVSLFWLGNFEDLFLSECRKPEWECVWNCRCRMYRGQPLSSDAHASICACMHAHKRACAFTHAHAFSVVRSVLAVHLSNYFELVFALCAFRQWSSARLWTVSGNTTTRYAVWHAQLYNQSINL